MIRQLQLDSYMTLPIVVEDPHIEVDGLTPSATEMGLAGKVSDHGVYGIEECFQVPLVCTELDAAVEATRGNGSLEFLAIDRSIGTFVEAE